jgi:hypothetical protein
MREICTCAGPLKRGGERRLAVSRAMCGVAPSGGIPGLTAMGGFIALPTPHDVTLQCLPDLAALAEGAA